MFVFTVDEDIELRLHEPWHAEQLFELIDRNRERLKEWFPWVEATEKPDDSLQFIRKARDHYANDEAILTSVWYHGELAGTLGLEGLDSEIHRGEIGYWLGARYEGNGIITRSCRALIDYAFDVMDLNRIVIRCMPANERSIAVAERLDFHHEGTLREVAIVDGEYRDLEVYSMLADEWST